MQHRGGHTAGTGKKAGKARGELAARTVIHGEKKPFQIGHEALGFEFLTLQPGTLLLGHGQTDQRPAQHGRHGHGRDHGHDHDHRVEVLAEHADR